MSWEVLGKGGRSSKGRRWTDLKDRRHQPHSWAIIFHWQQQQQHPVVANVIAAVTLFADPF